MLKTLSEFADVMEANAQRVRDLVRRFAPDALRARSQLDEFSVVEHICHLRDLERDGFTPRISDVLSKKNPHLFDFDGAAVARASDYRAENCDDALEAFVHARSRNVALLRQSPENAIDWAGHYEAGSPVTLGAVLDGVLAHDEDHLQRLAKL